MRGRGAKEKLWGEDGVLSLFLLPEFYRDRLVPTMTWVEVTVEPFLLTVISVSFFIGVTDFGKTISPGWDTTFLLPLITLVTLEAFFYSRRLARLYVMPKEWVVMLTPPVLLMRFLPYIYQGFDQLQQDVPRWMATPGDFFEPSFTFNSLLLLVAWIAGVTTTQCLNGLRPQKGETPVALTVPGQYFWLTSSLRRVDHGKYLRQLAARWLWGGVFLILLTGTASIGFQQFETSDAMSEFFGFRRPFTSLLLLNVVLYFVFGLLLLMEGQLARLVTTWYVEQVPAAAHIEYRWMLWGVAALAVVVAAALVLPTRFSVPLGELTSATFFIVKQVIVAVFGFLALLLALFLNLMAGFQRGEVEETPTATPIATVTIQPEEVGPGLALPDFVSALIFWLIVLGIVVYTLMALWRQIGGAATIPILGEILRAIWALFGSLAELLVRAGAAMAKTAASSLARLRPGRALRGQRPWLRRFSFRGRDPRELVVYFYLSVVEHASRMGYERRSGQTAREYSSLLHAAMPELEPHLEELTDVFIEARYGPRPPTPAHSSFARRNWQAIKTKLRQLRR